MAGIDGRQDLDPNDRHEDAVDHAGPIVRTAAGVVAVSVSRALYSKRVVLSASYKLSDRWAVLVDDDGPERWILYLLGLSPEGAGEGLTSLVHELTDQAVREKLDQETLDLRTLIVAQAFSEGNLLDPTRESDDPPLDAREPGADRPL